MDEYNALKKKRKQDPDDVIQAVATGVAAAGTTKKSQTSQGSFMDEYNRLKQMPRAGEKRVPIHERMTVNFDPWDIAPTRDNVLIESYAQKAAQIFGGAPVKEDEKPEQKGVSEESVSQIILGTGSNFSSIPIDPRLAPRPSVADLLTPEEAKARAESAPVSNKAQMYALYNQKIIEKNAVLMAHARMPGTGHSVLEELQIVGKMEDGDDKKKRKEKVLARMDALGVGSQDYALYTDDKNFNWDTFWDWLGSSAMSGLASFNKGITSTANVILGKPLQALGWEDNPITNLAEYYSGAYDIYKQNADLYAARLGGGGGYQFAGEAVEGTVGAIPNAILAIMTGGTSTAATTSSLATQSAYATGNVLTKAGLTTAGMMKNPNYWLSVARTLGTDYEEAIAMGADENTAALGATFTSLVNAGIEIGTDGMSGIQGLPKEIAEEGGNAVLKWAMSSIEEGGEEGIQKLVNEAVTKTLYDNDAEILNPKEYAKEMGIGTLSGMALGGGQIAIQSATNAYAEHQANKLTDMEQSVVDKITGNRIAQQEADGKTLTNKEKSDIKKEVEELLRKGYLSTDDIESVLAEEKFKPYKEILDEESSIRDELKGYQTEYENLSKKDTLSLEETVRKNELTQLYADAKAKLNDADRNGKKNYLKANLSKEVYEMTKGTRLVESYFEEVRSNQLYEADLTQYEGKGRDVIQKVMASGLADNSNQTHEFWDMAAKIANDRNQDISIATQEEILEMVKKEYEAAGKEFDASKFDGKVIDGYFGESGIVLNAQTKRALNFVLGHEIMHTLEQSNHYADLQKILFEYNKGEYDTRFKERAGQYENIYDNEDFKNKIDKEVAADMVGDFLFTDKNFVKHLSTANRNVFQKIWDEIKYLYNMATAGSKEARELEKVKKAFEDAYRANGKQSETKYSLSAETDKTYADAVMRGDTETAQKMVDEAAKSAGYTIKAYHGTRAGEFFVFDKNRIGDNYSGYNAAGGAFDFSTDEDRAYRWGDMARGLDPIRTIPVYLKAEKTFYNYESVSKDLESTLPDGITETERAEAMSAGYAYRKILEKYGIDFKQAITSKGYDSYSMYQGYENIAVYEPSQIKSADLVTTNPETGEIIPLSERFKHTNPDIRYSLSDSDGKQLTKEQQDYFKDSKMRDENGNLKVMYHGTPNGDYTVFKDGTYFTDNKEYADTYQNPGASSISTGKTATNPKTFEVYLDIKKPFDIADPEARSIYINDYIKGGNAMGINPYLSDAEYAKIDTIDWTEGEDLREFLIDNGYDYDGLVLDEGATGGYGDEVKSRGKSYVVFSPEQVKNIDNLKPTSDPDIRFSLSEAVEETKDLIAVHNLHTSELLETLKLSGLPSPSVAIIKAKDGHEKYGDVSLILPKDAIDPQADKANRIYGSDAWTPTRSNAQVEYEVNYDIQRQFERTVEELAKNVANGVFSRSSVLGMAGIEDSTGLNLNEIAQKISDYDAVQAAYVAENGGNVEVVYRTKEFDAYGNDALKGYIDKVGAQEVARLAAQMMTGERLTAEEIETAKDALVDNWIVKKAYALRQKPELRDIRIAKFRERLTNMRVEDFVRHAWEFYEDSGATTDEIDRGATGDNLRAAANRSDVAAWVTEKLQGLLSEPGIYNGKEIFTPSGKRRSFKETHWDYTAENIVQAMNNADARGANVWNVSGEAIIATATPEYKNIDEVRADKGRLFNAEKGDYEQIKDEISNELQQVTTDIVRTTEHQSDNQYDEEQIIGRVIMEAAQGTKTLPSIKQVFKKNGYRIGDAQAKAVLALFDHASQTPTGYFEAKPQRVVGFDEVGVYVIPYDADAKLKQELLNRGYAIAEYDPQIEGDRQRVVNQFEEYKFSLSNVGDTHKEYGRWNVYSKYADTAPIIQKDVEETATTDDFPIAPVKSTQPTEDKSTGSWRELASSLDNPAIENPARIWDEIAVSVTREVVSVAESGLTSAELKQKSDDAIREYVNLQASVPYGESYTESQKATLSALHNQYSLYDSLSRNPDFLNMLKQGLSDADAEMFPDDIAPVAVSETETTTEAPATVSDMERVAPVTEAPIADAPIKTTKEKLNEKLTNRQNELANIERLRAEAAKSYDDKIAKAQAQLDAKKNKDSKVANGLKMRIERLQRLKADIDAKYAKRIQDITKSIDKNSLEMEKDHTEKDRYERAKARIERVLESDKAALTEEYAQRKADLESKVSNKNAYTSNMAKELYDELRSLRKGVRASANLGSLLDAGYDWGNLRSAMTNVRYNPNKTVNPNSAEEGAVRQLISESYENDVYGIDDMDVELSEKISELESKADTEKQDARRATQRRVKQEGYSTMWESMIGDTSTWKDMALGLQYKTKTLRRILRKVVKDANGNADIAKADQIYDEIETKYDHNEALLKRESQRLKESFANMKLTHAEDTYAQMLGELRHNPDTTLTEDVVKEYYEANKKKIDTAKVDKAIEESRKLYDDLLVRVNEVLHEQGFKEVPYRKGYFPHFTNPKQNWLQKALNWKPVDTEIPTSIAGITENFKPQRSWQSFNKQRMGDQTDYSLYQGLDTYIHGALDWIYHIEDLQKRRALENHLRYIHSEEGVQKKIQEIKDSNLDAEEAQDRIDAVLAEAKNPLSGLVRELMNRTNTLANKKSSMDRTMEDATNRKIYSTMTNLNNRINANMVVGSVSSALTNFIPIAQSWHQVSPFFTVRGLGEYVRSVIHDDGMVAKSDFLTNRLIEEEKLYQTGWDKVSNGASFLMGAFDSITSQTVWRSKYLQNIKEGMGEAMAIKDADQFAKNLMAGRSRGNMPTIFDAKNPFTKLFTAFQLEVANQYGYMFDDVVKDSPNKARLVKGYATAFVGAYLYNTLYSSLVGRNAAFDPIRIIQELIGDLGDDEKEPEDVILNFTDNIIDELPFVGGLSGGGRIPMSSALPYGSDSTPFESMLKDVSEGKWDSFGKELLRPLYYLAMPVGGGQIKKTVEGLSMFSDDHPITGSYTDSGALRFPVEKNFGNMLQAGLFGQYASENAREYFDNDYAPLGEKQIQEFMDVDIPIRDYWEYREGLSGLSKLGEKADYIDSLDLPIDKKNLLINNIADREDPIDMTGYGNYDSFDEFDFAVKNPDKYEIAQAVGGYEKYMEYQEGMKDMKLAEKVDYIAGLNLTTKQKNALINGETDRKEPIDLTGYENYGNFEEFEYAKKNPENYAVAKAVGGYEAYKKYSDALNDIKSDKDEYGQSISGSRKEKVQAYINGLDADYYTKLILYKSEYTSYDDENMEIINYLNQRNDISYKEMEAILLKLGFKVDSQGNIFWD